MSLVSDRLKYCRQVSRETQEEIGAIAGVHKSTVQRWESGETSKIGLPTIEKLANHFNVRADWLSGKDVPMQTTYEEKNNIFSIPGIMPIGKGSYIPLIGNVACGKPILAVEDATETLWLPENIHADFALRCKGDSMINARINDNDIVYIHNQPTVDNGEIAAVIVNDEEVTLKRVYYYKENNLLILKPENSSYEDQVYQGEELAHVRIIGKAVHFLSVVK